MDECWVVLFEGEELERVRRRARASFKLHETLSQLIQSPPPLCGERRRLAAHMLWLAVEHHGAFAVLGLQGFYSAQQTLLRSVIEATARIYWLLYYAQPDDLVRVVEHPTAFPTLDKMLGQLRKAQALPAAGPLIDIIRKTVATLDGFAHVTGSHLDHRSSPERIGFTLNGLSLADGIATLAAAVAAPLYGRPEVLTICGGVMRALALSTGGGGAALEGEFDVPTIPEWNDRL
ncbi:MAG TPA: hypothetical protein VM687_10380 [Stenotrophomonas sp.]|nr:hypothetical protein [Stenotrophomonas sp.]